MTSVPSADPTNVVKSFFDAYRKHDVERMTALCDDMAGYRSVPFELWRKQRVIRGDGKVGTIGKIVWTGLIEAFPDLTNEVTKIISGNDGRVAAEVLISGTQAKDWGSIRSRGRRFRSPHLFVFEINDDERIADITSYSDNASVRIQLGCVEID
jgi:ketosteroid isomerase-like protein